jgi:hypothetical protein
LKCVHQRVTVVDFAGRPAPCHKHDVQHLCSTRS